MKKLYSSLLYITILCFTSSHLLLSFDAFKQMGQKISSKLAFGQKDADSDTNEIAKDILKLTKKYTADGLIGAEIEKLQSIIASNLVAEKKYQERTSSLKRTGGDEDTTPTFLSSFCYVRRLDEQIVPINLYAMLMTYKKAARYLSDDYKSGTFENNHSINGIKKRIEELRKKIQRAGLTDFSDLNSTSNDLAKLNADLTKTSTFLKNLLTSYGFSFLPKQGQKISGTVLSLPAKSDRSERDERVTLKIMYEYATDFKNKLDSSFEYAKGITGNVLNRAMDLLKSSPESDTEKQLETYLITVLNAPLTQRFPEVESLRKKWSPYDQTAIQKSLAVNDIAAAIKRLEKKIRQAFGTIDIYTNKSVFFKQQTAPIVRETASGDTGLDPKTWPNILKMSIYSHYSKALLGGFGIMAARLALDDIYKTAEKASRALLNAMSMADDKLFADQWKQLENLDNVLEQKNRRIYNASKETEGDEEAQTKEYIKDAQNVYTQNWINNPNKRSAISKECLSQVVNVCIGLYVKYRTVLQKNPIVACKKGSGEFKQTKAFDVYNPQVDPTALEAVQAAQKEALDKFRALNALKKATSPTSDDALKSAKAEYQEAAKEVQTLLSIPVTTSAYREYKRAKQAYFNFLALINYAQGRDFDYQNTKKKENTLAYILVALNPSDELEVSRATVGVLDVEKQNEALYNANEVSEDAQGAALAAEVITVAKDQAQRKEQCQTLKAQIVDALGTITPTIKVLPPAQRTLIDEIADFYTQGATSTVLQQYLDHLGRLSANQDAIQAALDSPAFEYATINNQYKAAIGNLYLKLETYADDSEGSVRRLAQDAVSSAKTQAQFIALFTYVIVTLSNTESVSSSDPNYLQTVFDSANTLRARLKPGKISARQTMGMLLRSDADVRKKAFAAQEMQEEVLNRDKIEFDSFWNNCKALWEEILLIPQPPRLPNLFNTNSTPVPTILSGSLAVTTLITTLFNEYASSELTIYTFNESYNNLVDIINNKNYSAFPRIKNDAVKLQSYLQYVIDTFTEKKDSFNDFWQECKKYWSTIQTEIFGLENLFPDIPNAQQAEAKPGLLDSILKNAKPTPLNSLFSNGYVFKYTAKDFVATYNSLVQTIKTNNYKTFDPLSTETAQLKKYFSDVVEKIATDRAAAQQSVAVVVPAGGAAAGSTASSPATPTKLEANQYYMYYTTRPNGELQQKIYNKIVTITDDITNNTVHIDPADLNNAVVTVYKTSTQNNLVLSIAIDTTTYYGFLSTNPTTTDKFTCSFSDGFPAGRTPLESDLVGTLTLVKNLATAQQSSAAFAASGSSTDPVAADATGAEEARPIKLEYIKTETTDFATDTRLDDELKAFIEGTSFKIKYGRSSKPSVANSRNQCFITIPVKKKGLVADYSIRINIINSDYKGNVWQSKVIPFPAGLRERPTALLNILCTESINIQKILVAKHYFAIK